MSIDFKKLDQRRARLRMTKRAVANRAGVSLATVNRILSGKESNPSVENLAAIAKALGVTVRVGMHPGIEESESAHDYRMRQARRKAKELMRQVQGTMALEAQAVDGKEVERMAEQAAYELLTSNRRLWSE